jgi:hypothetical protein
MMACRTYFATKAHECRLTLRCTRRATAGFAVVRTRVNSNVRPHPCMLTTFLLSSAVIGLFVGAFAGKDTTHFAVGLAYALALVVTIVLLVFASGALITGEFVVTPFLLAALLFGVVACAAYAIAFTVARRLKSKRA